MMKTKKRQRRSRRDAEEERDRLSELSDCILLHIMEFMDTTDAVQTCVLAKRWRHLWKRVNHLSFERVYFRTSIANYNKFVSRVLSRRDGSIPLLSLDFVAEGLTAPRLLNKVMEYVVLHDVPQLTVYVDLFSVTMPNFSIPFIFFCPSLTFLKLSITGHILELPESLQLPALKSLYLEKVSFTASDDVCAEPFSACILLNTLILKDCSLYRDARALCISNCNLSSLSLDSNFQKHYTIMLSTPNLCSLTVRDHFSYHLVGSTCNLSFLEEVNIDLSFNIDYSVRWWQVLANVKTMTLSWRTLKKILDGFAPMRFQFPRNQPPCFVRLESLKMEMNPDHKLSDEEIAKIVEYFLQNSPLTRVAVISC